MVAGIPLVLGLRTRMKDPHSKVFYAYTSLYLYRAITCNIRYHDIPYYIKYTILCHKDPYAYVVFAAPIHACRGVGPHLADHAAEAAEAGPHNASFGLLLTDLDLSYCVIKKPCYLARVCVCAYLYIRKYKYKQQEVFAYTC